MLQSKLNILPIIFLTSWFVLVGAANACTVSNQDWKDAVNGVTQAIDNGKYQEIKEILGRNTKYSGGKELFLLLENLEDYAPSGFSKCRKLMRVDIPPLATKILFEFTNSGGDGIYVYMFLIGGKTERSGITIIHVSTEIEDMLNSWGSTGG